MKRQQIIWIIVGALMAIVCAGAAWLLFSAMGVKSEAEEARSQKYAELQKIYGAKVFPNDENIARVKEDEKALLSWLGSVSNLVHKGDLSIEKETPPGFKQLLQNTVRALSATPGTAANGKIVASGFSFGFDKYLGESDSLPAKENVDRLTYQLKVIELICNELYAAKILSLDSVVRETFEEAQSAEQKPKDEPRRPTNRRNNRRDREATASAHVEKPAALPTASGLFEKQRFTFVFKARPDAFVGVLNRLAAMDQFVVIAEAEFHKTEDPLMKREADNAKKKSNPAESNALGGTVDPATVPHAERIVTDPELDPPVSVKLDIDVYSFEGV
jgi:hypothetical protein